MSIAFLLTTLVVVAAPGTGALFTIAAGLSRGRRASLVAAIGCTVGIVPHMVAAIAGLAALLHASSVAFSVVFAGYGLFASAVRSHVISRPRVVSRMRRTFGASYAVLAGRLALAER